MNPNYPNKKIKINQPVKNNQPIKNNKPLKKKPSQPAEKNPVEPWIWIALVAILITTLLIYIKGTGFNFVAWDDGDYIPNNPDVQKLQWANIKLFFSHFYVGNYQPLTMLFYALEYQLGAGKATIFHVNNLLLHMANTLLVFILIRKISPKAAVVALITAAFFAVHPMHVESVAWISERKDVLYSFFLLLSLILYADYLKSQKIKDLLLSALFFILSCLSKSAAVILPLLLLLFDYYLNRKFTWKTVVEKIPFFALSLLFGIIALTSQKGVVRDDTLILPFYERLSIVSYSFISYLVKALVPLHLSAIYPYPVRVGETLPPLYHFALLGVVLILVLVFWSRKWGKEGIFGFLFFTISIILVLQFFPVGDATMADRYTYIPYIGLFFILAKLFEYLSSPSRQDLSKYKYAFALLLISGFLVFSFSAFQRVKVWENDELLFTDVIQKYPKTSLAYNIVGCVYLNDYALKKFSQDPELKNSYLDKAEAHFTKAIEHSPTFVLFNLNRGISRFHRGQMKEALDDFNAYISVLPNNAEAYNYRGKCLGSTGDLRRAILDFDKAIELNPSYLEAYGNRSIAKYQVRDLPGTLEDCEKVLQLNGNDATAQNLKARVQQELKK